MRQSMNSGLTETERELSREMRIQEKIGARENGGQGEVKKSE